MKKLAYWLVFLLIIGCGTSTEQEQTQTPNDPDPPDEEEETIVVSLNEVWATAAEFLTPESVLYDAESDILYVSNINGNPAEKDGNGFISRLNRDGSISELRWVEGLDAPKGMGLLNGSLFVADIDRVVEIDIESGEIVVAFPIEGSSFLNDITAGDDIIYISDTATGSVFSLNDGNQDVLVEDAGQPNGLFFESGILLILSIADKKIKSFDTTTGTLTELADIEGNGDGIVPVGEDDYLVSDFDGAVYYFNPDWESTELLNTKSQNVNAADIEFIINNNLLLVPTFSDNRVVGYELEKTVE